MSMIKPFRGVRPVPEKAAQVASPPYDVLNSEEARKMAEGNPNTFLHVVKPEIDLDPKIDLYSDEVYAKGAENLQRLQDDGVMTRDEKPCFYLYRQKMRIGDREHVQTGLVAGASCDEYDRDLVKKHELTRADKEKDRTRHVETLNANTGPVFLTYNANADVNDIVAEACKKDPTYDFTADDGIVHTLWVIDDDATIKALTKAFEKMPHLYVADGHHRSASAAAVGRKRKEENKNHTGEEGYNFFLSVIFPHDQMYIMDYNRVVLDLGGLGEYDLLRRLEDKFQVLPAEEPLEPRPTKAREFGMYMHGKWYQLIAKPGTFDENDPVQSLDVSILQNNVLGPLLGITDPRRDKRIDFVGGIRGTEELERRVKEGAAVAFCMYPTSIEQLIAIADAGEIMPPKSTWFEPKLRSGLVVRPID